MTTVTDADQLAWFLRILLAGVAGAVIGFERELHSHPAGMRTHLLVSAGSAAFTILSMHGFADVAGDPRVSLDPSRVAAQILAGIGFIGGGAILKYGVSIRGLTTAGSLWATAAVGFAFGSGLLLLGGATSLLIVFSLWPLNVILAQLHASRRTEGRVRLGITRLDTLGAVYECLVNEHVGIGSIGSQRIAKNHYQVPMRLHVPPRLRLSDIQLRLASLDDVDVLESRDSIVEAVERPLRGHA
jgi:putative Mg2+ transporter-C (MgtC) family protein